MYILSEKNIAISSYSLSNNRSYRSNIISSLVVINSRKVKDSYIDCNSYKDFQLRNSDRISDRF